MPGHGYGGAIFSRNGTVTITSSTLANNFADEGAAYILGDNGTAEFNVTNSILAYSLDGSNVSTTDLVTDKINGGTLTAGDFDSLIVQVGTLDGASLTASSAQHIQVTDPLLKVGPFDFSNNGGTVPTLSLQSNSPAIDEIGRAHV